MKPGRRRYSGKGNGGFTLLELLIALTLTGVLLALLFSGFRFATRARDSGVQRAEATGDLRLIHNLVRRQLHQAQPLMVDEPGKPKQPLFTGQADQIEFVAPLSQSAPALYRIKIAAENNAETTNLVLRYRPYFPGTDNTETLPEKRMVLVEHIKGIDFAYFGPGAPDTSPSWNASWQSEEPLPQLVRLSVLPLESSDQAWPELIAATKASSPRTSANAARGASNARRRATRFLRR